MDEIRKILIVGAGTMGHGLAFLFARGGFEVALVDKNPEALDRASRMIDSVARTMVKGEVLSEQQAGEIPGRIHTGTSIEESGKDADLAIETVDEDPNVKRAVFRLLDTYCPKHAILASNTSALNIFSVVETEKQDRIAITHFFAPPYLIPLVEVVPGEGMSSDRVNLLLRVLESLGKTTLLLKSYVPGFIVNRIQRAIAREAFSLTDKGIVSIEEMDKAVKASLGIRLPVVGVMQTYDFTGLDVSQKISRETPIPLEASTTPSTTISDRVKRGELGVKTGKGLYDYSGRTTEEVLEARDLNYLRILSAMEKMKAL